MTDATTPEPTRPLRTRREALGLSIRALEERTGINRGRLSIIERGVPPEPDEAAAIERALREATEETAA